MGKLVICRVSLAAAVVRLFILSFHSIASLVSGVAYVYVLSSTLEISIVLIRKCYQSNILPETCTRILRSPALPSPRPKISREKSLTKALFCQLFRRELAENITFSGYILSKKCY